MTSSYDLPLPGDAFGDGTVIASVWPEEEEDRVSSCLLIVLNPAAPFYTVAEANLDVDNEWVTVWEELRDNINGAVELFAQSGGDA